MSIIDQNKVCHDEMTPRGRLLNAYPETAFEEIRTADFVATKLERFEIAAHRGLWGLFVHA